MIYGRKYGTALTMDVFTPKEKRQRRRGHPGRQRRLVLVPRDDQPAFVDRAAQARLHGASPSSTAASPSSRSPRCVADMNRAVRFIRYHATDYKIDPDRIGITGGSAGGHLSLMQGSAGDDGRPEGQGPGRPGLEPRAGRGLLLPADRLPQLRQAGREVAGHRARAPASSRRSTSTSSTRRRSCSSRSTWTTREKIGKEISPINHVDRTTRRP